VAGTGFCVIFDVEVKAEDDEDESVGRVDEIKDVEKDDCEKDVESVEKVESLF
jgi:hypothetical protein